MAELAYFDADAHRNDIVNVLREDGACVLKDVMDDDLSRRLGSELGPLIEATPPGRDDFTGRLTGRTGALVARSEASRELVMHPSITDLARDFLQPFTEKIQLHLTQIINISPGRERNRDTGTVSHGVDISLRKSSRSSTLFGRLQTSLKKTAQLELFLDLLTGPKTAKRLTKKLPRL